MAAAQKEGTISALKGVLGYLSFLRLGRRRVLEVSAIALTLVLAVILRILPIRWGPYFTAFDPLFQYRVTEYVVKNGFAAWNSWHDTLSWYPMGRDISQSSFPGLPFSAAFAYMVLQALGFKASVYDVCLFFPLFTACLACISIHFLGKDLGGRGVGLFAAFFMAISSAFIRRTSFGFFDTENIGIFGMTTTVLLFLRSVEEEKPLERSLLYAAAAGLMLGYLYASWGASRYVTGILTLYLFASLVTGLYNRRQLTSYCLTMGIGFAVALMVPKLGIGFLMSVENVAVPGFTVFLLIYETLRTRLSPRTVFLTVSVLFVLMVAGGLALSALGLINPMRVKFLSVLDPSKRSVSPLLESVQEHKKPAWSSFFEDFGLTLGFAVLGSIFSLRKVEDRTLFALLFFLSALYFAGSMVRLDLILSIPMSLMAAYGLKELLTPFVSIMSRKAERRRRRRTVFGLSREMGAVFTLFILIATLPNVWNAASTAYIPTTLATSGVPVMLGGAYPQDWLQALAWMRDNLPDDAVVVSWWDYGYWIETMANKTTLADGATRIQHQIAQIARIMMYNQSGSHEILERYGATHILVFHTFNPNRPTEQWPFGDNVKWAWMASIGGLNESDYFDGNRYTDKFTQTTLNNLMNRRADPDLFRLAYSSEHGFVLIYEVDY